MIQHLADRPSRDSVSAWLSNIAQTNNVNPHVHEEKLRLNGVPALKVLYRTADGNHMETVYVVAGRQTFALGFNNGDGPDPALEHRRDYPVYLKMLHTFRIQTR